MELNRFKQLLESTMGNVKPLIMEQITGSTLTLENINNSFNKIIFTGMVYRGNIGGETLKGVIVMDSESSSINKRNNWGRPERIDIDFTTAKKLEITPDIEAKAKEYGIVLTNPIRTDYNKIYFTYINQTAALFGEGIESGKIKNNSVLIRCVQGNETLFIFQSLDNSWYYVVVTGG